jgi:hypothetical protein
MPIEGGAGFTYVGYTLGDIRPTLYFTQGRYTQVHGNADNVGWHPARPYHRGANISLADHTRYKDLSKEDKRTFKADFLAGRLDSNAADAKLFECSSNDNRSWRGHRSRAKLIKPTDAGFNAAYNEAAAKAVLAAGVIAPNEIVDEADD